MRALVVLQLNGVIKEIVVSSIDAGIFTPEFLETLHSTPELEHAKFLWTEDLDDSVSIDYVYTPASPALIKV